MILTCPNCSTRYLTKPEAIGGNGRSVRCSKCSNTWFVTADPDALALEDQAKPDMEMLADDDRPQNGREDDRKNILPGGGNDRRRNNERQPQGAHVAYRDNADKKRRNSRIFGVTMIWVTTLALLGLAALLAFLFRQPIVEKFPQTAAIYEAFSVETSSTGLILDTPQTEYVRIEGEPRLIVNGVIQNLTKQDKDIPLVRLSILNRNDEEITHWFAEPGRQKVGPRGKVEFATEYPNPPVDAASLAYELAADKG